MRLLTKALTLTATVVTLAAIGGGVAFAGWFATSPEAKAKVRTAAMPGFDTGPAADVNARKKTVAVRWVAQKVVKGERVQRYVVRRYNTATGVKLTVCGDEVVNSACQDTDVPPGSWAYTVQTAQYRWTGPESPRSGTVTIEPVAAKLEPTPAASPLTALAAPKSAPTTPPAPPVTTAATTATVPAPTTASASEPLPVAPSAEHTEP